MPSDEPPHALIRSGEAEWISVRLLLRSPDVRPTEITALMGVQPHASHEPGARVLRRDGSVGPVVEDGWWQIAAGREDLPGVDWCEAAKSLFALLPSERSVWEALPACPTLIVSVGLPDANCWVEVAPEVVALVAGRGVRLTFDIYGENLWGEE